MTEALLTFTSCLASQCEVGIDPKEIQLCALSQRDQKLQHELENPAWSPRAIRINGWRYSGMLEADLVARAVCSGFIHEPLGLKPLKEKT